MGCRISIRRARHIVACASPAYLKSRGNAEVPEDVRRHNCLYTLPPRVVDDALFDWINRGFDLYDGLGRDPRLRPLA